MLSAQVWPPEEPTAVCFAAVDHNSANLCDAKMIIAPVAQLRQLVYRFLLLGAVLPALALVARCASICKGETIHTLALISTAKHTARDGPGASAVQMISAVHLCCRPPPQNRQYWSPLWFVVLSSDGELRVGTADVAAQGEPPVGEAGASVGTRRFI